MSPTPAPSHSPKTLRLGRTDGVAKIELNRPEKRNALSPTMARELANALAQATCSATEDMAEGIAAFIEKREPRFRGR